MTKTIAVLCSEKSKILASLKEYFKDKNTEVFETDSALEAADAELCVVEEFKGHLKSEILELTTFLKVHPSLLPAFDCENPIEEAFKYGVKISGVTVNYINNDGSNGKIIAQYPVFVDVMTTLEEFEQEIFKVEEKLVPFVVESVLNNVVFSFDMLLKPDTCTGGGCDGGCGGCTK